VTTAAAEAGDEEGHHGDSDDDDDGAVDAEEDLEKQIAKELAAIKRPRREQTLGMRPISYSFRCPSRPTDRVANCQTNTPCGAQQMIPRHKR
jgi:hypothetical protein